MKRFGQKKYYCLSHRKKDGFAASVEKGVVNFLELHSQMIPIMRLLKSFTEKIEVNNG